MQDPFGRTIDTLRISVTDRCNLRCRYCMPTEGVPSIPHHEILSYEEIAAVARTAAGRGISRLRLTGGEPLVRRGVSRLVALLAAIPGVADLALTTNGTLLAIHADQLAAAGLHRVNISLDSTDPERFAHITRGGQVDDVFAGIAAARRAGLTPIKLNCVVEASAAEEDARGVAAYGAREGLQVRFIQRMDPVAGRFAPIEGGHGGDCPRCNRLRLTSDGMVRPCLLSDIAFSVRTLGAGEALERAVAAKPEQGGPCTHTTLRQIGG